MKIYMAPLEGVTGFVFRNAYEEFYGKGRVDKYFIPFISPNKTKGYTTREQNDIRPEHNVGINTVPQIMANDSELFLEAAAMLNDMGYKEINLNLGCPSGTVVSKFRGAGFLARPLELDSFLDKVLSSPVMKDMNMSVKTRTGLNSHEEFRLLLEIYNDYPLSEIIIHPRVRTDYYKNTPDMEIFKWAVEESCNPVCYNGDIFTIEDYVRFAEMCPEVDRIMLGRGFVGNPGIIGQIGHKETPQGSQEDGENAHRLEGKNDSKDNVTIDEKLNIIAADTLKEFTDKLLNDYIRVMDNEVNAMHKMKEVWIYINQFNPGNEKAFKKIKKSHRLSEYEAGVEEFVNSMKYL